MCNAIAKVASAMADNENDIRSKTESVCELFSGNRDSEAFEYLRSQSESPLQVPFHYLDLVEMDKTASAARAVKPTPAQVELAYRAILQRAAEDDAAVLDHVEKCDDPDQLIAALLCSSESILRMPELYARAFPFERRLWHVHIPKTAGSSFFAAAAESGWGFVNTNMLSEAGDDLRRVASAVRPSPTAKGGTIVSGHWRLPQYLGSIGPFDRVVVFVRDPVERFISEFNYAVDVLHGHPNVHAADPTPFLERGLEPESFSKSYQRGFFSGNVQCSYLSADATCASTLSNLAKCHAELLPYDAVDDAVSRYFPGVARKRMNASNNHVRSADVGCSLREEIIAANHHDFVLQEIAKSRYQLRRPRGGRTGVVRETC
jgi:hypothetical protein